MVRSSILSSIFFYLLLLELTGTCVALFYLFGGNGFGDFRAISFEVEELKTDISDEATIEDSDI